MLVRAAYRSVFVAFSSSTQAGHEATSPIPRSWLLLTLSPTMPVEELGTTKEFVCIPGLGSSALVSRVHRHLE